MREQASSLRTKPVQGLFNNDEDDYEAVPRRHYREPQICRQRGYQGPLDDMPDDQVRAFLVEALNWSGACHSATFPLPPTGLPGKLRQEFSRYDEVAELLALGIAYLGSAIRNEGRGMHNRWTEAAAVIQKIEDRADERVRIANVEAQMRIDAAREVEIANQQVYFIGSESGPIKIGIAVRPLERLKGLQTGHHERLHILATCAGGHAREQAYHKQFAAHRLNGEWFARHQDIRAEIEHLNETALLRAIARVEG